MDLQMQPIQQQQQQPKCEICFTTEKLSRCAKCRSAFYCSIPHQHMDWPVHKKNCRLLAKKKKMQQLTHATNILQTSTSPTTTFPIATAAAYTTPNNVNGSLVGAGVVDDVFTNYMNNGIGADLSYNDVNVNVNVNVNQNQIDNLQQTTMSVIPGANFNQQNNVNIFIEPTTTVIEQQQQLPTTFFMDTNTNSLNLNNGVQDTLSTLSELSIQQQREFSMPQYQQTGLMQQQEDFQLEQHQQQSPQLSPQTYDHFRNQNNQHEKSSSYQIGQVDENVMANFNERRYEELCRNIINDMNQYGLSVVDDFLGVEKGMEILGEVHDMYCAGVFQDGQLVNNRRTEQDINRSIRGDKITWVKGVEPGCTGVGYLINQIDAVICRANTMKNNGKLGNYNIKERTKAMVACYPGSGTQYVTHVDNPNKDGRVITAIYYLNVDWDAKRSGGVLRIFPEATNTIADIEPKFDRLIFFWSDKRNPHEVQPSHRTRYAITVWYFDANEREAALNRCKYGNLQQNTTDSSSTSTSKNHQLHHHHNSSNSNSDNNIKSNNINHNSNNISCNNKNNLNSNSHFTAGFSKANENSNPNLNANFNNQNEICT